MNPETIRRKVQNGESLTPEERRFARNSGTAEAAPSGPSAGGNAQQMQQKEARNI